MRNGRFFRRNLLQSYDFDDSHGHPPAKPDPIEFIQHAVLAMSPRVGRTSPSFITNAEKFPNVNAPVGTED